MPYLGGQRHARLREARRELRHRRAAERRHRGAVLPRLGQHFSFEQQRVEHQLFALLLFLMHRRPQPPPRASKSSHHKAEFQYRNTNEEKKNVSLIITFSENAAKPKLESAAAAQSFSR